MRNYKHIDRYINQLYQDIYAQPEDTGHSRLAQKVIDQWMSGLTTCQSILDAGCGEGFCQPYFERWGKTYEGIAIGNDVIKAQEKGRNVKAMDFSFLEYDNESFDLIFSRHSLEHSPMPLLTLMEWARASKNWLGLVMPHSDWYGFKGLNHYSVMELEQVKLMLDRAGWYVIWENIDQLPFEEGRPETIRNHEIWLMCEKKRG